VDSFDGHIKGFRTSSEFEQFMADVGFSDATEEMRHYARARSVGAASSRSSRAP
jgi:hypothetical protein